MSRIYVLAGVNGAGKSTIAGAAFREFGTDYYNPDEAAHKLIAANRNMSQADANSAAWHQGVRLLRRAIEERRDFAFETTLGANTIPRLLAHAASQGIEIYVWYVGLSSPELHIERVQSRVRRGGHDIPAEAIHRRYERSRLNLIELLPRLAALRVYDNSLDADPAAGRTPKPMLVLHMQRQKILNPRGLTHTPEWAKPLVAAAMRLSKH
ncbi:MAG: ZTL protein [Deltaproteobacteria bacterium RIFCSPLOWO2_12_FULL_60_19]|nr:MAG: ZTL protein [Deltaproteobacteria bacterium RIFCSPLOWO2_12_FULL_60_19]